jgi:two-component system phosphate regulon sensor histidine kinase PhoR
LTTVLLFALPGLAAIAILAVLGLLGLWAALAGAVMALTGTAALVLLYFRDAAAIADYLDGLGDDGEVRPPHPHSELGRALVSAVTRLVRHWRNRERSLSLQLDAIDGIMEALPDPLIVVDRERSVVRANEAAETLFGSRPVGRDLAEVLRLPQVLTAVDDVLCAGRSHTVEFSRPVPIEQVYEARIKPYGEAQESGETAPLGAPSALITLHDITAIKRSEQMRADFVANASHELRTPLSTLIGFIETLRGPARDDTDARDRFLGIMEEQAGRMSRLINDLLSLSRIELDEHTAPVGKVDLPGTLGSVVDLLQIKRHDAGAAGRRVAAGGDRRCRPADPGLPESDRQRDQIRQPGHGGAHRRPRP